MNCTLTPSSHSIASNCSSVHFQRPLCPENLSRALTIEIPNPERVQGEAGDLFAGLDVDKRCEGLPVAGAEFVGFLGLEVACTVSQVSGVYLGEG
jgi:hypothetical protein